jgi:hypothetical protein
VRWLRCGRQCADDCRREGGRHADAELQLRRARPAEDGQATGGTGGTYAQETYTYSAIGNILSKAGVNYTYNATVSGCSAGTPSPKPHAVSQVGSYTFSYDCNGNMLTRTESGGTYNQTWDFENRLTGVAGTGTATFVYDGDGNRVKATVAGVTTAYVGNHFEQSGTVTKTYIYAGTQRVALRDGSTLYFLLGDHLGSTAVTANSSTGALVAELRYKPWGETRYFTGTTPTTYRFTGQREEVGLGSLYFYQARFYSHWPFPERGYDCAGGGESAEPEQIQLCVQ